LNPLDLAWYFFPFFFLIYAWNSWKDFKTKRVNVIGFALLNGMLYTGFFVVKGHLIIVALLLTVAYAFLYFLGQKKLGLNMFSLGDFSMLLPFSLFTYLFLSFEFYIVAHLLLFLMGFVWLKLFKNPSFCPPVFFTFLIVFAKLFLFG